MSLLELERVSRIYEMASETIRALDGVDLRVNEGEIIILLGPSGSGKTTLLNCLSALDTPTGGTYFFDGDEVPKAVRLRPQTRLRTGILIDSVVNLCLSVVLYPIEYFTHYRPIAKANEAMTSFRRENIGYVFQFFNLLQDLTVLENILLIQELAGGRDVEKARHLLELVELHGEAERFPAEISGGQQQRVAIARSIAKSPKLLLGDELTGNLDSKTSAMVMEVLVKVCKTEGITCIFVTHDESLMKYATRVVRLDSGKITSDENVAH